MGTRLEQKVAVITGAAGGIGAEMAQLFAGEGAAVVVCDIDAAKAEAVARQICASGGQALPSVTDISSAEQVDGMFHRAQEEFGGVDILVNNAFHAQRDVTIIDLEEADWDRTIAVCLKGPYLCTRRALPLMQARGAGSVVTMSSVNALFGVSETAYTAAKGGLISMMRLVAAEYGSWKIRSNVICPGTIGTQICLDYWRQFPRGFAKLQEMYPLGRIGTPREVANLALFLASDESSFITGSVQVIDGGLLAGRKFENE
jgi:NAD(P)-dependent dehydrogenase (short-subunit alcohol dehydrogenase family)